MITNEALEWTSDDEANLRAFLASPTGKRFLPKLVEGAPVNLGGGPTNEILIRGGEVRGFSEAVRRFLELSTRPQTPAVETESTDYPSLTDDAKWADGQKINEA